VTRYRKPVLSSVPGSQVFGSPPQEKGREGEKGKRKEGGGRKRELCIGWLRFRALICNRHASIPTRKPAHNLKG